MKTKIVDLESEYIKMKHNNRNLAKALAEQQQITKKYSDENNALQKKLYMSSSLNMQYKKTFNDLLKSFKQSFNNCIELTNNLSNMLILCKEGADLDGNKDSDLLKHSLRSTSPVSQKTQAVKPMVGGHVIHHPIINLSRLTETSINDNQVLEADPSIQSTEDDMINMPGPTLPIRGYIPQFDIENESDESIENDSFGIENDININSHSTLRSLEPVIEYSDEENATFDNIFKEVRIVLEPLHLNNINKIRKSEESKRKRIIEDPLEGTSTMLDDTGNLFDYNNQYNSKPRQASKRVYYESESEESNFSNDRKPKRFVTKRKTSTEKKDVTGQKYKVKSRSSGDCLSCSSNTSSEENISNDSHRDSYRRSRRSASKSLAEPSLKKKLRR